MKKNHGSLDFRPQQQSTQQKELNRTEVVLLLKSQRSSWTKEQIKEMYLLHMTEVDYYIHKHQVTDETHSTTLKNNDIAHTTNELHNPNTESNEEEYDNYSQGSYKRWTEDEITEMGEMDMTVEEYCDYRNLAGIDNYSISSAGEETEANNLEADKKDGWYDEDIQDQEIKDIKQDNEEYRIRELFEPRDAAVKIKEETDTEDKHPKVETTEKEE